MTSDLISRQAALDALEHRRAGFGEPSDSDDLWLQGFKTAARAVMADAKTLIRDLPAASGRGEA